jgi:malate dehydrogenase (oxaloacetate-decarboxylating)
MEETEVFAIEAAEVAEQAAAEGVARATLSRQEVYDRAMADILESRKLTGDLMRLGYVEEPPRGMLEEALAYAIAAARE